MEMKAKINNENKAKFFAQYWGQKIVFDAILIGEDLDYVDDAINHTEDVFKHLQLLLKPLSLISDEDAIELSKYFKVTESDFWTGQFSKYRTGKHYDKEEDIIYHFDKVGKDICEMIIDTSFFSKRVWHKDESDIAIAFDYLRSKGYALPWMGLSVEELVQSGWIKLIE